MELGAAPLLERHRIFHSRNVEEAHAYAGRAGYCFAFRTQEAPELDVRVNGIYLPRCYIGYVQYGPAVEGPEVLEQGSAGNACGLDDVCDRDAGVEMGLDVVDRASHVARSDGLVEPLQRFAVVVRMRQQQGHIMNCSNMPAVTGWRSNDPSCSMSETAVSRWAAKPRPWPAVKSIFGTNSSVLFRESPSRLPNWPSITPLAITRLMRALLACERFAWPVGPEMTPWPGAPVVLPPLLVISNCPRTGNCSQKPTA